MFINTVSFILWTSCPLGTRTDVTGSLCVSQEHCVIFSPLSNSSPVNTALKSGVNKRLLKGMPFKKKKEMLLLSLERYRNMLLFAHML